MRGHSLPIRIIHWLTATVFIVMILAGIVMVNGNWGGQFPPLRGQLYDIHRGLGFVLLILVLIRIVFKFTTPAASPLPATIPASEQKIAHLTHVLLYAALIVHPLLGWYATNMWGVANIPIFGLFNLPTLVEKNREMGDFLLEIHGYLGFAIGALVLLHILAAFRHLLIKKDGVFQRMIRT